jgi:hypothetical protein
MPARALQPLVVAVALLVAGCGSTGHGSTGHGSTGGGRRPATAPKYAAREHARHAKATAPSTAHASHATGVPRRIATVDGRAITRKQFERAYAHIVRGLGRSAPDPPTYSHCIAAFSRSTSPQANKPTPAALRRGCEHLRSVVTQGVVNSLLFRAQLVIHKRHGESDAQRRARARAVTVCAAGYTTALCANGPSTAIR